MASTASGASDAVDLGEDLLLEVEVLGHGLHDELAVPQVAHVGGEGHPAEQAAWSSTVSLPRETARSSMLQDAAPVLDGGVVHLHGHDVDAVAGEHLHDAGTHGSESRSRRQC